MSRRRAVLILSAAFALAVSVIGSLPALTPSAFAADEQKQKKEVDAAAVYYGDAKKWEKPAEVKPDDVYAQIAEYKQILDEGLKPGDAKYDILMCKASKRFTCAVKKAAKDGSYDLVAKSGSVKGAGVVPDITKSVIDAL